MATTTDTIQLHIEDTNNPHNVTKEDIGLGNVVNNPIATDIEAFEGSAPTHYVTPAKLRKVFDGILTRQGMMDSNGNVILR